MSIPSSDPRTVIADALWKLARLGVDVDHDLPEWIGEAAVVLAALEAAGYVVVKRAPLDEMRLHHGPEWVSDKAKADGKEPWVCFTCGTSDGSWPCTTWECLDDLGVDVPEEQP